MDTAAEAREEFRRLLEDMKATKTVNALEREGLNAEYKQAIIDAASKLFPSGSKGKTKTQREFIKNRDFASAYSLLGEAAEKIQEQFTERAELMTDRHSQHLATLKDWAREAAEKTPVLPGELELVLRTVTSSDYSSQGFGASTYARNSAESACDQARCHGIEAQVVLAKSTPIRTSYPMSYSTSVDYFEARVKVKEELDLELIKHKPGPTLREWVRLCWKRGVNPRVYNPFLPHGLEEKLGLDYQGNEVKEKLT